MILYRQHYQYTTVIPNRGTVQSGETFILKFSSLPPCEVRSGAESTASPSAIAVSVGHLPGYAGDQMSLVGEGHETALNTAWLNDFTDGALRHGMTSATLVDKRLVITVGYI